MKHIFIAIILVAALFTSCQTDEVFTEDGITKIYMPQASTLDGGITNNYPVPLRVGNVENYVLDTATQQLRIVLGVKNSGRSTNGFSVNLQVNLDTTNQIVSNEMIAGAVALPEGSYVLPETATVEPGTNEQAFYLDVDMGKIISEHPEYYANKLVLAINISGHEDISPDLATTVVVIDGSKFLPVPPPPPIETMLDADAWVILPQSVGGPTGEANISVIDGNIHYSSGTTSGLFNHVIYQPLTVTAGQDYVYDMNVDIAGIAGGWIQVYISKVEPVDGGDFNDNKVYNLEGSVTSPMSGLMSELSEIAPATYTATETGTIYFVIKIGSWGNNFQDLTLSDIVFKEAPEPPFESLLQPGDWSILKQDVGGLSADASVTITDGNIQYSSGTTAGQYNHAIYQPVSVTAGQGYVYDMNVDITGAAGGWIQVYISTIEPVEGGDFNDNKVYNLESGVTSPMSGKMSELSDIAPGTYTVAESGTIYFVIKIGSWGNNFEDLKLSEIVFKEN
ncbi:MAG: hypothetical protein ACK5M7_21670 [Draconibacterium sp.]